MSSGLFLDLFWMSNHVFIRYTVIFCCTQSPIIHTISTSNHSSLKKNPFLHRKSLTFCEICLFAFLLWVRGDWYHSPAWMLSIKLDPAGGGGGRTIARLCPKVKIRIHLPAPLNPLINMIYLVCLTYSQTKIVWWNDICGCWRHSEVSTLQTDVAQNV